jgi:hypothetical protein
MQWFRLSVTMMMLSPSTPTVTATADGPWKHATVRGGKETYYRSKRDLL